MIDRFTITLAGEIIVEVQPVVSGSEMSAYQLYIEGKYHGEIYPDIENPFIEWKSYDNIDPYLVQLIGRAIEDHDA
jgi:dissimilatory sulfite reductase (desulfoviridin) alpha/beta subunit